MRRTYFDNKFVSRMRQHRYEERYAQLYYHRMGAWMTKADKAMERYKPAAPHIYPIGNYEMRTKWVHENGRKAGDHQHG